VSDGTTTDALRASFTAAVRAAEPGALVEPNLPDEVPSLVLAVGKGALGMLAPARLRFPTARWVASPPRSASEGSLQKADQPEGGLVLPGAHPLPDAGSERAAEVALASVGGLGAQDLVLVLVSGGGSALWSAPSGIDLAAKRELISRLLLAGAGIDDLNVVRKHLSRIKGGLLARATRARLLTLALSDVPGDDPATIASGPTVPDPSTYAQAVAVLDQFGVASAARSHLADGARGLLVETPKPGDEIEARSQVRVIGSNKTMLDAAAEQWRRQGFPVIVLSDALTGEAHRLARSHADLATALVRGDDASSALAALAPSGQAASVILQAVSAVQAAGRGPVVVLSGGEATVTVTGTGRGGRNQEFALWLHHYLRRSSCDEHVAALVAGSDGVDGNSPAAGAVISATTARRAASLGLSPAAYLRDNDSFSFFERLGDTVVTGPTGTNLNDYRVMLVGPTG
jgi:hydroxypyruvate reductase